MAQAGIPLFYLQGMGGGAILKFRDLFNDSSLYWGWRFYTGDHTPGKHGVEANGQYSLSIENGTKGCWDATANEAPRIFMSPIAFPCEIITRLDEVLLNDETFAGLFISKIPSRFGGDISFAIGRKRFDARGEDGISVIKDTYLNLADTIITDLPIWLRIRLGGQSYNSLCAYFDYSLDGLNWVNLYTQAEGFLLFGQASLGLGLYVANGAGTNGSSSKNEIIGRFDHFIMRPRSIN